MAGAALMAAHGAVRSGAGKVFLRVPGATAPYCIGVQPEIMVRGVGTGDHFTAADADEIIAESKNWSVLAMGPGLGRDAETKEFLLKVLAAVTCPVVLDADALNLLAGEKALIASRGSRIIMTPHLAEFSRISGLSMAEIKADPIAAARQFASEWKVNLVLKGAPTLMCSAACAGVYLHGAAGDACRKDRGPYGFTPMETADALPQVLASLEEDLALPILQQPLIGGK